MKFILLITLYQEKDLERQEEYLECLNYNLENPNIEEIVVLFEYDKDNTTFYEKLKKIKIKLLKINKHPYYLDFMTIINEKYKDKICIIANSDIFFTPDKSLNLLKNINWDDTIISLTRYNQLDQMKEPKLKKWLDKHDNGIEKEYNDFKIRTFFGDGRTQDSWIFKSPIDLSKANFKFKIGTNNCDGYMNNELAKLGLKIYNPALDIITIHNHKNWEVKKYLTMKVGDKIMKSIEYRIYMLNKGFYFKFVKLCTLKDIKNKRKYTDKTTKRFNGIPQKYIFKKTKN